jgi:hypothetical protein
MNRVKYWGAYLAGTFTGQKPTYEQVETAIPGPGGYEYMWYAVLGIIAAGAVIAFLAFGLPG